MIEIMYVGPCTWDPKVIGWSSATIGYTGEYAVKTAGEYIRRDNLRNKLVMVVCNGQVLLDLR